MPVAMLRNISSTAATVALGTIEIGPHGWTHIRIAAIAADGCNYILRWSLDGIATTETVTSASVAANTLITNLHPIKGRFCTVFLEVDTAVASQTQLFAYRAPSNVTSLTNIGAGARFLDFTSLGIRTLTSSDGSITLSTAGDTTVDLTIT